MTERPTSEAVDALLEAGEEEGILEESDRELVRSVVEFGDKVVREVMTPRPEIFAVPSTMTLAEFTGQVNARSMSRVPVYSGTLDEVVGIAFARDLLGVDDAEAGYLTVASLAREAHFVPETKKVNELLREMQRGKQHMSIVIDEYGGVAGLVTIEDLLEAIVGNIEDEHDTAVAGDTPVPEEGGTFVVPGSFEVSRLRELFAPAAAADGEDTELDPDDSSGTGDSAAADGVRSDHDRRTGERDGRAHSATRRGGGGWAAAAGGAGLDRPAGRTRARGPADGVVGV